MTEVATQLLLSNSKHFSNILKNEFADPKGHYFKQQCTSLQHWGVATPKSAPSAFLWPGLKGFSPTGLPIDSSVCLWNRLPGVSTFPPEHSTEKAPLPLVELECKTPSGPSTSRHGNSPCEGLTTVTKDSSFSRASRGIISCTLDQMVH